MLELRQVAIGRAKTLYSIDEVTLLPGKLYALIGANGAGKSTLLDAIALGDYRSGEISLNHSSIANLSLRERALLVALVEKSLSRFRIPYQRKSIWNWGVFRIPVFRGCSKIQIKLLSIVWLNNCN